MPEDAEAAGDQPLLDAVALGVLVRQEPHERLGHREPHDCHLAVVIGSRGSISWPSHGVPDPGVGRVVGEAPRALAGPGHHVQVVEVVAGRGHRRAVVAAGQQHRVAAADLLEDVDPRAVGALVGEAAVGDLEVVDLLERRLDAGDVLVVLVRADRRTSCRRA